MMIINQKKGIEMEKKRIIERMKQLADLIHYEPGDISHLANAMCVNVLNNGNTSNKEYSNGSLATLGDTVLKMIITEKLYLEGKDTKEAKRYMNVKKLERDPRAFVFAKQGFHARTEIMSVPTSSWTTDPEKLPVGGYAYDHLSSADFTVGDFPFHEFVRYISGKSSFGMVKAVREFYSTLSEESKPATPDGRMTEKEIVAVYYNVWWRRGWRRNFSRISSVMPQ